MLLCAAAGGTAITFLTGAVVSPRELDLEPKPLAEEPVRVPLGARRPRPPREKPYRCFSVDACGRPGVREAAESACVRGDFEACDTWASMLRSGTGGKPDQELALVVSQHACQYGHEPSCALAETQLRRVGPRSRVDLEPLTVYPTTESDASP